MLLDLGLNPNSQNRDMRTPLMGAAHKGHNELIELLVERGAMIDLVFSDVQLEGSMTGFGLARWVTENRPAVPVLLASGDLGKACAQQELWGAEIMPKPYDFDSVVRRIHAAIETRIRRTA